MNPAKKTVLAAKNFVTSHKTPIAFVTGAAIGVAVTRRAIGAGLKEAYEFIEANGLTEKFVESSTDVIN